MTQDSNAILTLCSHICVGEGVHPLEPKEYSDLVTLLKQAGKTPRDLFDFSSEDFGILNDYKVERTDEKTFSGRKVGQRFIIKIPFN